jgi:hypothetical protein
MSTSGEKRTSTPNGYQDSFLLLFLGCHQPKAERWRFRFEPLRLANQLKGKGK